METSPSFPGQIPISAFSTSGSTQLETVNQPETKCEAIAETGRSGASVFPEKIAENSKDSKTTVKPLASKVRCQFCIRLTFKMFDYYYYYKDIVGLQRNVIFSLTAFLNGWQPKTLICRKIGYRDTSISAIHCTSWLRRLDLLAIV